MGDLKPSVFSPSPRSRKKRRGQEATGRHGKKEGLEGLCGGGAPHTLGLGSVEQSILLGLRDVVRARRLLTDEGGGALFTFGTLRPPFHIEPPLPPEGSVATCKQ